MAAGTCQEVFELLSDYLDLELPAEVCQHIEHHLADCPPCVEFAQSLRETIALCREYAPGPLPPPLDQAARAQLEAAWRNMLAARQHIHREKTG